MTYQEMINAFENANSDTTMKPYDRYKKAMEIRYDFWHQNHNGEVLQVVGCGNNAGNNLGECVVEKIEGETMNVRITKTNKIKAFKWDDTFLSFKAGRYLIDGVC